jgi:hypothetical protein
MNPLLSRNKRAGREMGSYVVAKALTRHYYNLFDNNRENLAALYQEGSMLASEGEKIQVVQRIVRKLTSLPFQQCKGNISQLIVSP